MYEQNQIEFVPIRLPNGAIAKFEILHLGREDVAFDTFSLEYVTNILEGLTEALQETVKKTKPDKLSVKFGLELAIESGNLTAMIVKGSSKGNLEITLEWDKKSKVLR